MLSNKLFVNHYSLKDSYYIKLKIEIQHFLKIGDCLPVIKFHDVSSFEDKLQIKIEYV